MDALSLRQQPNRARQTDSLLPTRTAVLHLRPAPTAEEVALAQRQQGMRVTWNPDVREPVNQRVSKCCCVFHKKKVFGESSSESSSSGTDSSDDDGDADHRNADAGAGGVDHEGECGRDSQSAHQHLSRKHRPKCTKEHCYCDTRFH
ncbi:hypothetical protein GH5_06514 [Leishmania sp. Ghana 2012 LV757]|uniref:Protein phosphatase inhibitor n=1 Tax=Leishmania orientalis TaxID=2249476 RepID=A0A836HMK2_9TRYP|nr:hypothetical protein LSCM4_06336 [Leishmania orientalis]KAG5511563.1 hypothetical protein GH5_06514 [Leishmania sp. Ghana 2012 LV757]